MTDELVRVSFHLDPDPRLVGVLRSAVQFQAAQAGLESNTCSDFGKASEDVCRETITHLAEGSGGFDVTMDTFQDRIELTVHHHGQLDPEARLQSFAVSQKPGSGAERLAELKLLSRVDRVLFSSEDGIGRTSLVKFLHRKR